MFTPSYMEFVNVWMPRKFMGLLFVFKSYIMLSNGLSCYGENRPAISFPLQEVKPHAFYCILMKCY